MQIEEGVMAVVYDTLQAGVDPGFYMSDLHQLN